MNIEKCPFCGLKVYPIPEDRRKPNTYGMVCGRCNLKTVGYGENLDEEELIRRWNRRAKE